MSQVSATSQCYFTSFQQSYLVRQATVQNRAAIDLCCQLKGWMHSLVEMETSVLLVFSIAMFKVPCLLSFCLVTRPKLRDVSIQELCSSDYHPLSALFRGRTGNGFMYYTPLSSLFPKMSLYLDFRRKITHLLFTLKYQCCALGSFASIPVLHSFFRYLTGLTITERPCNPSHVFQHFLRLEIQP